MHKPLGVILAGGQGSRMGHVAKADVVLGDKRLLDHCLDRLTPQVDHVVINSNTPLDAPCPVIADTLEGHLGPLAGVLAGLSYAANHGHSHIVTVAVDTPFFPFDLVRQLQLAGFGHPDGMSVAATSDGLHGTCALWPASTRSVLEGFLHDGGRKVRAFTDSCTAATAQFPDTTPSAFFNINTPQDLAQAQEWV